MNTNMSNESPFLSSNRNNSSIIPDILEQIKKKSEELSTSDASLKFLHNLSNPTNLTNPQILTSLNNNQKYLVKKNNKLHSLNPNKLIFSNDYTKRVPKKSKSEAIFSNLGPFSTIDPFNLDIYYNLIDKAKLEILSDKNNQKTKKRIMLEKINRNIMSGRNYNNLNNPFYMFPNNNSEAQENENIWEKIKKANIVQMNKEKDKKINFIKFIPKRDYIEKTNLIKLLQYNNKNTNKRYYNYLSMKNSQIKTTNNTMNKILKSKEYFDNKYNDEFVAYINYLEKELEKEKNQDIILKTKKNEILYEVNKLKRQIDKITIKKKDLIKWLYLQIQVRENIPEFPKYYKYILESNYSLDEINQKGKGKYKINLDEYFRIINYKGKNGYDNVNDFLKKIEDLEIKSLTILNGKLDSLEEYKKLNREYEELKRLTIISNNEDNDKINELNHKLREVKKLNYELKNKLMSIKVNNKNNIKYNDKILLSKLMAHSEFNSNIKSLKILQKNEKNMIYYLALCTYYITNLNSFEEMKNYKIDLNLYKEDNKMILEILVYAERILNLLISEKKYYYSIDKLKKIYLKIKEEMDKKTKMEKMMIQIKIRKEKEIEKSEKLKEKINKNYYKPKRKIDYDYYRKELNKKNNLFLNKSVKKETKFEDFFYDIDSESSVHVFNKK